MAATNQDWSLKFAKRMNRLDLVLLISALSIWLIVLVIVWIAPEGYGLSSSPPSGLFDAARFHLARGLYYVAHVVPFVVIILVSYRLLTRRSRDNWALIAALCLSAMWIGLYESIGYYSNTGLPFGYYGKLNRVVNELEEIPGLEVVDIGLHKDTTLEDFWITIELGGVKEELAFEGASARSLADLYSEFRHLRDAT